MSWKSWRPAVGVVSLIGLALIAQWLLGRPSGARVQAMAQASFPAPARPRLVVSAAWPSAPPSSSAPTAASSSPPVELPRTVAGPVLREARNFLLIGLDRRADGTGPGLADTILIAAVDSRSGHAGLVSVPRDLWVDIPEHGPDRINVILALAANHRQNGLELMRRVIEGTLGLPIEHVVAIDLGVFERAVDAVGGVDVLVPCPIIDSFADSRVPEGHRRLEVESGEAHMDGVTAAMYVRSRHGRSDFGRARRQQAVLLGLRQRLLETDGLTALPELLAELDKSIKTDLRRAELLGLVGLGLRIDATRWHGLVLSPPNTRLYRTEDGKSVLLPEPEAIQDALSRLFSAPAPGAPLKGECPAADAAPGGHAG
jgi:polyisoprenyl-teichoic acid--peptidoglycan teichoic acid transferase